MEDIIQGPSWLNKALIEKALREGEDTGIVVESFEITRRNAEGDGYCSNMFWVKTHLKNNEERRLIVKCNPEGEARQNLATNLRAFEKEIRMLSKTLPALHKILDEAKPGKYPPFGAKCLYSGEHPEHFIIMEDLGHAGFTVLKRQDGMSLPHCRMVMKTLGRFHAASLSLYDQKPEEIRFYKEGRFVERMRDTMGSYVKNSLKLLIEEVSKWPDSEKYIKKLEKQKGVLFTRLQQLTEQKDDQFYVLNHGDLWTNNMMFKTYRDNPEDMRFIDLQLSHYTSPAADLQYFLHSTPADEVRVKHMDSLIVDYHSSFLETLDILGNSKYAITLPQLKTIFNDYALYGFHSALGVLPVVLSSPEYGFDLDSAMDENDAAEGTGNLYANPEYIKIIKRLLPRFVENSVI